MIALSQRLVRETKGLFRTRGGGATAVLLLFLVTLALTGCAESPAIAAIQPTATLYPPPPTDTPSPRPGPTPAALDFPLPAPNSVVREQVSDQTCVQCHTDKEALKAVAE